MRQRPDKTNIGIIDYGMGNLTSVSNSLSFLGIDNRILKSPRGLENCSHLILPGVGAFGEAISRIKSGQWVEPLSDAVISKGTPVLGICLGMQLLATSSEEFGIHSGLDWVHGRVTRIERENADHHIPHVGWNDVKQVGCSPLYADIADHSDFYFVHSYCFRLPDKRHLSGTTLYGESLTASIERDHIFAVQFHPEKSGPAGLRLLENFTRQ